VNNVRNEQVIKSFGKKLWVLRNARGWSQEELANRAGIPLSQIGRIERGEVNVTISTQQALATALEIAIRELLTFD